MKQFNNINNRLIDDLKTEIKKNSKLSIAAACFSIYAYENLKEQLESIEELRFIFTSPAFLNDRVEKERREFYIPRIMREKSLYGTEFEIRLRNQLKQKSISKECADWIRAKVKFKSNITKQGMVGFLNIENANEQFSYIPINGFTTTELGNEKGNDLFTNINKLEAVDAAQYLNTFEYLWNDNEKLQDVTDKILEHIETVYIENPPEFIYMLTLYNIFSEFLEDISEDILPNEATGFKNSLIWNKLYNFQKDAALSIIHKLEKFNGCILADSVGLGKTFSALAVIKYYENRNKSVLVLCPKKLNNNWITFKSNLVNNPILKDRLNYAVLHHSDILRTRGTSNGLPLDRINWGNYDLVVIDESHNFRNGEETYQDDEGIEHQNRYAVLLNKIIKSGVKTKVLMLSATPVNNHFLDLKNQLALAYEGVEENINEKLNTQKPIETIFRNAQRAFNDWSKLPAQERTTAELLKLLEFDFFELLDSVTIARSRKHIEKYYDMSAIGKFPTRLKPINKNPSLTTLENAVTYSQISQSLDELNLSLYTPASYILPSRISGYEDKYGKKGDKGISLVGRGFGLKKLMAFNLLKRLESSVYSFRLTVGKILKRIDETIEVINSYEVNKNQTSALQENKIDDLDFDNDFSDLLSAGGKYSFDLKDMDYKSWLKELSCDREILNNLLLQVEPIKPENDNKLLTLFDVIKNKIDLPINNGNKKILIFTAFADTAQYLYENLSKNVKEKFGLNCAMITGSTDGKTTIDKMPADFNTVLTCFSPKSKERSLLSNTPVEDIDILIGTDCISEGQNLQDCDYLINFDIHWNPVRIIQRFGRIDRIGSFNEVIQLVNFWPDLELDEYIKLRARVENKMKIAVMTSTGDDNPIDDFEKGDLEYRRRQLEQVKNEVIDAEDMNSGITIMDLGLNEFRLDLIEYHKRNADIDAIPFGMHAVVSASETMPAGVIYILKNVNNANNIDNQNHLHPFYMVYLSEIGKVVCNHLEPKKMLDIMRFLCKDKSAPDKNLTQLFNKETRSGYDMSKYSDLLQQSIQSIINVKEESDIDSLFSEGATTILTNKIQGLDDFELICFLVLKDKNK